MFSYCTHIKIHGIIFVFDWQENSWGINFRGHGGKVGTIIQFAKYASYCGLIFGIRGIPKIHENLYTSKISTCTVW